MKNRVFGIFSISCFLTAAILAALGISNSNNGYKPVEKVEYTCGHIVFGTEENRDKNTVLKENGYFYTVSMADKVYYQENHALRLGSSNSPGSLKLTLTNPTDHIMVYAKRYPNDGNGTLTINGHNYSDLSKTNYTLYDVWLDGKTRNVEISNNNTKRISIQKITIRLYNL